MSRTTRLTAIIILIAISLSAVGILLYKYDVLNRGNKADPEHTLPAIKIILTNGCGFEGLAREFTSFLTDKNVDIISIGNTRKPIYDKTIIVIRKGNGEDLKRLQRMTGINRFTEAKNEEALAEFEIIIGKDYEQYYKK